MASHTAAACSGSRKGRLSLVALQLLALGLFMARPIAAEEPLILECDSSFKGKSATLVLTGASVLNEAYAVCFQEFTTTVADDCTLTVTPAAFASQLEFESTPCPTEPLQGGIVNGTDLGSALRVGLQNTSFSATLIQSAAFQGWKGVVVQTSSGLDTATLAYAVKGATFSWPALTNASDACGPTNAACRKTAAPCGEGRYADSGFCALCPPGHFCSEGAREPCEAGFISTDAGSSACTACDVGSYRSATGGSVCVPCPENTAAHFTGSTGCLSCYFGMPKVVAGVVDGVAGFNGDLPDEQPKPGYRIVRLPASSSLRSCPFKHAFNNGSTACDTTDGRTLAIETDVTCEVRVFVLGDSKCSKSSNMPSMDGAYRTLSLIDSRPEDRALYQGQRAGIAISFAGTPSLEVALDDGTSSCTDSGLTVIPYDTSGTAACPAGTSPDAHPNAASLPVFVRKQCIPCDAGFECSNGTALACTPGKFNELLGASTPAHCIGCPAYTISKKASVACSECAEGTTPNPLNPGTCMLCPPGTYNNVSGTACLPCAAGTFRLDGGGDGTTCTPCPPGSWSPSNASTCTLCEPGYIADVSGSTSCSACGPGSFADSRGALACNDCPAGSYSDGVFNPTCTDCPPGEITVSPDGSGVSFCVKCKVGTWKPPGATDNKCRTCPAGWETGSTLPGASTCTECRLGHYNGLPNTALCTPCPKAFFANKVGMKVCKACPAGQITDTAPTSGATVNGTGAFGCTKCAARRFRPSMYAANTCTLCPKGRETKLATGASGCTACVPGTTLLETTHINCTACPAGEYSDAQGFSGPCKKCPKGYASSDVGASACDVCEPGQYQDEDGQLTCKDCPVGTYTEMTGGTEIEVCVAAPKGNYAPGTGNDGFIPCEGGTYQDEEGQGACKPCPPGHQCPSGSLLPTKCRPGFWADMKQPFCKECAKGTYQDREGQRSCKPCPAGSYCQATKMAAPSPCPAGKYGVRISSITPNDCAACPINSYTAATGLTKCTKCTTGLWTARKTGQKLCWDNTKNLPTSPSD